MRMGLNARPRGFICLGVAKELYSALQDLGADPEVLIVEVGLDPHLFGNPRNLISAFALGNFLHLCAERMNCPHIGLLVGQRATLGSLRLVGSLMSVASGHLAESEVRQRLHEAAASCGLPRTGAEKTMASGITAGRQPAAPEHSGSKGAQNVEAGAEPSAPACD